MPLDSAQSAPGNRISGPDGEEYDVVARVATDVGPFVVITSAKAGALAPGLLVSEGHLRDHEDVAHVSTIAEAKAEAAATLQAEEDRQIEEDRQARIQARAQAQAADDATDTTGTTGTDGIGGPPPSA